MADVVDGKREDGGQAFPFHRTVGAPPEGGMTLRDWFAGQVLPMLADIAHDEEWGIAEMTGKAYLCADAMLAARVATGGSGSNQ